MRHWGIKIVTWRPTCCCSCWAEATSFWALSWIALSCLLVTAFKLLSSLIIFVAVSKTCFLSLLTRFNASNGTCRTNLYLFQTPFPRLLSLSVYRIHSNALSSSVYTQEMPHSTRQSLSCKVLSICRYLPVNSVKRNWHQWDSSMCCSNQTDHIRRWRSCLRIPFIHQDHADLVTCFETRLRVELKQK